MRTLEFVTTMDVKVRQQREKVEQLVKEGEALILGETLGVNIIIIVIIIIISKLVITWGVW